MMYNVYYNIILRVVGIVRTTPSIHLSIYPYSQIILYQLLYCIIINIMVSSKPVYTH